MSNYNRNFRWCLEFTYSSVATHRCPETSVFCFCSATVIPQYPTKQSKSNAWKLLVSWSDAIFTLAQSLKYMSCRFLLPQVLFHLMVCLSSFYLAIYRCEFPLDSEHLGMPLNNIMCYSDIGGVLEVCTRYVKWWARWSSSRSRM